MLVKALKVDSGDTYLIPGDIHFDQQDNAALDVMLGVAAAREITGCILVGDTFESSGISRHSRPGRKFRFGAGTIKAEARAARPYITALRDIVGRVGKGSKGGGLYVLTGNHENWWTGVQDEYPGLVDTPWYELYGDLFDGWHIYEEYTALKTGPLLVCHGHRLRGSLSKYSAAAVLSNYPGQNTLYGHTHRVDSCTLPTFKYGEPVRHGAWSIGHMKDREAEIKDPFVGPHSEKHQQGFALVSFATVGGEMRFNVEQVTIDRDTRGRPYAINAGVVYK